MKTWIEKALSFALWIALAALLVSRLPQWYRAWHKQGTVVTQSFELPTIRGDRVSVPNQNKTALIFWATWCGPCTLELSRVERLIDKGKLAADRVLAVALDRDLDTVKKVVSERGYRFPVAIDASGEVASFYGAEVTPTVVLLNSDNSISWMGMGLSPLLEVRILAHF